MTNGASHIDYDQIAAYLSGETSPEESLAIENWIKASDANREIYDQCVQLFNASIEVEEPEEIDLETAQKFDVDQAWMKVAQKISIPVSTAKVVEMPLQEEAEPLQKTTYPWLKIAAALVVATFLGLFYYYLQQPDRVMISGVGETEEVFLADGSTIVLQGASTITYYTDFNENNRNIELSGKAYFDVKDNELLPFIITTQYGQVTVIGTSFVVEETPSEVIVEVDRGKVRLASKDNSANFIFLERNQRGWLYIDNNQLEIEDLESINHLFWANRKLTYRSTPLVDVFKEIEEFYGREIVYDEEIISNCRISAIYVDQSFEAIINNISISLDFDYSINGNQVEILSNGCTAN